MKSIFIPGLLCMFGIFGCSSDSLEDLKMLGNNNFSAETWKNSSQEERGTMVFSFLQQHDVTSMKVEDVQSLLGESTAYYEYDEFPAYLVGSKEIESEYGRGYLLAFPFDRETGIVRQYVILPKPKK